MGRQPTSAVAPLDPQHHVTTVQAPLHLLKPLCTTRGEATQPNEQLRELSLSNTQTGTVRDRDREAERRRRTDTHDTTRAPRVSSPTKMRKSAMGCLSSPSVRRRNARNTRASTPLVRSLVILVKPSGAGSSSYSTATSTTGAPAPCLNHRNTGDTSPATASAAICARRTETQRDEAEHTKIGNKQSGMSAAATRTLVDVSAVPVLRHNSMEVLGAQRTTKGHLELRHTHFCSCKCSTSQGAAVTARGTEATAAARALQAPKNNPQGSRAATNAAGGRRLIGRRETAWPRQVAATASRQKDAGKSRKPATGTHPP
jgi:hypothetical protein